MLTDSVSQFETNDVNDIPKSFQKLINEIQNVKKHKKQPKNPPLNVKTIQKNPKKLTTVKKKKKLKPTNPLRNEIDSENNNDECNSTKNPVITLNQTNITEFFNTVKKKLSNRYPDKNLEEKKQEVFNMDEEIFSDDDNLFYSNLCSNRNATTDFKNQDLLQFQNPDYLNFLSSRNDLNTIAQRDNFENTNGSLLRDDVRTKESTNWKTFNEMNTNSDYDFATERKKAIAPSVFYSHSKSNTKTQLKTNRVNNNCVSSMTRNQNIGVISNEMREISAANNWLAMLKDDQEKMTNLLGEVGSMNDTISKAIQDISKFFRSRNM